MHPSSHSFSRSTWLWKTKDVITDSAEIDRFVEFAMRHRIRTVYVHINPDLPHVGFANFMRKCAHVQIFVQALIGDPNWLLEHADDWMHPKWLAESDDDSPALRSLKSRLSWIKGYQELHENQPSLKFTGIHLDVEPWVLPNWEKDKHWLIQQWKSFNRHVVKFALTFTPPLQVMADLPFWAHELHDEANERLDVWFLNSLSGVAYMTYRNTPDALMHIARPALQALKHPRARVILAVETVKSEEGSHISYHGSSKNQLERHLDEIERKVCQSDEWRGFFGGLAVHDYHGWAEMQGESESGLR